jgi:hypothetical protein
MKLSYIATIASLVFTSSANAGLIGTDLTLSTLAQSTSTSTPITTSFPNVVRVSGTSVEYPNVSSLYSGTTPPVGFANSLVNTAIDVGDNFIEIDFDNVGSSRTFASGFQNTYVFQFDSAVAATFVSANINPATTLGLTASDVTFAGNRLFVNVESLSFNPLTFVRIDLGVLGGPSFVPPPAGVPLPGTALLLAGGFLVLSRITRNEKASSQ